MWMRVRIETNMIVTKNNRGSAHIEKFPCVIRVDGDIFTIANSKKKATYSVNLDDVKKVLGVWADKSADKQRQIEYILGKNDHWTCKMPSDDGGIVHGHGATKEDALKDAKEIDAMTGWDFTKS
jgi:hypothetical protein